MGLWLEQAYQKKTHRSFGIDLTALTHRNTLLPRPLRITPATFLSTLALSEEFSAVKTHRLALRRLIRYTLLSL